MAIDLGSATVAVKASKSIVTNAVSNDMLIITSKGEANVATKVKLSKDLSNAQKIDPRIGTTLSGAKKPITVTAESNIKGKYLFDTNQTARPITQANIDKKTLIHDLIAPNKPNSNMANAHAEIALIQRAYDAGLTKGQDMTMIVRG